MKPKLDSRVRGNHLRAGNNALEDSKTLQKLFNQRSTSSNSARFMLSTRYVCFWSQQSVTIAIWSKFFCDCMWAALVLGSQVCRSCDVSRSLEPDSWLARTEGCLRHAVLRETQEEPFEGPLPDLIVDRCTETRTMWLTRLTPRLSRRRANSVADLGKATRSCNARVTSALLRRWSAINCRDPKATPSAMLPSVTA